MGCIRRVTRYASDRNTAPFHCKYTSTSVSLGKWVKTVSKNIECIQQKRSNVSVQLSEKGRRQERRNFNLILKFSIFNVL